MNSKLICVCRLVILELFGYVNYAGAAPITQASVSATSPFCSDVETVTGTFDAAVRTTCVISASARAQASVSGPVRAGWESTLFVDGAAFAQAGSASARALAGSNSGILILGGSGTGSVTFTFNMYGRSIDKSGSAIYNLSTTVDGITQNQNVCPSLYYSEPIPCAESDQSGPFTFTFGVPLNVGSTITLDASVFAFEALHLALGTMTAQLTGISVRDGNGNLVPGATIVGIPEPGVAGIAGIAIALGILARRSQPATRLRVRQ